MLDRLATGLPGLPPEDRIGLLSDSFSLVKAGALDPIQLVKLLSGCTSEMNDKVWSELSSCLAGLEKVVRQGLSAETSAAFINFAAKLVNPSFASVGWDAAEADDDNRKKLRNVLVG